jgi:hypothetical protein
MLGWRGQALPGTAPISTGQGLPQLVLGGLGLGLAATCVACGGCGGRRQGMVAYAGRVKYSWPERCPSKPTDSLRLVS